MDKKKRIVSVVYARQSSRIASAVTLNSMLPYMGFNLNRDKDEVKVGSYFKIIISREEFIYLSSPFF